MASVVVAQFYQRPALSERKTELVLGLLQSVSKTVVSVETEFCCYVASKGNLSEKDEKLLRWILKPTFDTQLDGSSKCRDSVAAGSKTAILVEVGPRLNFSTAYSTNAVSICQAIGLGDRVERIERSTLYLIRTNTSIGADVEAKLTSLLYDRMTEQRYAVPLTSFALSIKSDPWTEVDVMNGGVDALRRVSVQMGLSFDEWDLNYYTGLFRDRLKRNPTSVECFDLAQSNSEHSRHWFFGGRLVVDGVELKKSLIKMVMDTQCHTNDNSVIKFRDNSSAIRGFGNLNIMTPANSTEASLVQVEPNRTRHVIFTAETHNFPTGVAPFQGATTGTGGRIRDVQAAGRGAHVIAGTAGYSFGNLLIPGYDLPWEDRKEIYPHNFAKPVEVCVEASNGASDYGNKFGEPVLAGFARSFGMRLGDGDRCEYIKPIMFSGGIGTIDESLIAKNEPEVGMLVAKVGGPIYRIGVGGGAASSIEIQGDEINEELDYGAVQRGDAEMEQKLNRLIRACIEYTGRNPIQSIHDQGAGGNGNVLKEIVDPKGAVFYTSKFTLGDPTINTLELWGAEYQESNAILVDASDRPLVEKIGRREKCQVNFVGTVTGDGRVILVEGDESTVAAKRRHPVDLELQHVLGSMPKKEFQLTKQTPILRPLALPRSLNLMDALNRVLRLPSVASKRYLTSKVDRCVTGLVAQQQCVGPLDTPLADYAMIALSYFNTEGAATSIGEQPVKGLISCGANARLSVAEAITNLMFAVITDLADVKCSGNWMWPAKLKGEGSKLVDTCVAMCDIMKVLRIAVDGGKDSLSMAARVKLSKSEHEVVKSPGTLVISAYAPVPDVRVKVTPVMAGRGSKLIHIPLSGCDRVRVGASALAQVYGQVGNDCPDIDRPELLRETFAVVQKLIKKGICSAGHDVSDGGLITCLLEMAFATNCGLNVDLKVDVEKNSVIDYLFGEECGVVIEVKQEAVTLVKNELKQFDVKCEVIGEAVIGGGLVDVNVNGINVLREKTIDLMSIWEETSFELDKRQANPACVQSERDSLRTRKAPKWKLTFDPDDVPMRDIGDSTAFTSRPRVAVVREEGINSDREMMASLYAVGFEVADVTVTDILGDRNLKLESFRGLIFPGGFSFADVLGSARGWAATMMFNEKIDEQMKRFRSRSDTFSLGVCNGCQLLALLGWVGATKEGSQGTLLARNDSERFECRFTAVRVETATKAMMLRGMHGSTLGIWSAHGEGKFVFKDPTVAGDLVSGNCIALRYVDDDANPTMRYPMNPNGSAMSVAAICSPDGRHLAMMPHPERTTQKWNIPFMPDNWVRYEKSPWCKMFRNAYDWCIG